MRRLYCGEYHYVQMLVAIARTESTVSVCKRKTELSLYLSEVRKQAERLCILHHVRLWWECRVRRQEIYAEPNLLMRALQNLFDNAVEHTPRGGTVSLEVWEDEQDAAFTVTDTGHV